MSDTTPCTPLRAVIPSAELSGTARPDPLPPLVLGQALCEADPQPPLPAVYEANQDHLPTWIEPAREGHLMTVAPTGAGKGAGHLIPALLTWTGPAVVLDVKGEAYAASARARREMGQDVVLLDPFGQFPNETADAFNPMDLLDPAQISFQEDCLALAHRIGPARDVRDPFWDDSARQMVAGLAALVATDCPRALRNLAEISSLAHQSPKDMALTLRDAERTRDTVARKGLAQLEGAEPRVRASIISTAQRWLPIFDRKQVAKACARTSFDVQALVDGAPMTIYIVVPPHRLTIAAPLLRVWLGALMGLFQGRSLLPTRETLFLIDEAWHLGHLRELETAATLMRGYGLRLWSFWQDLEQLRACYPASHATIVSNTATLAGFGFHNLGAQSDFAERFEPGHRAHPPLAPGEALVHRSGGGLEVGLTEASARIRMIRYFDHPAFAGRGDVNPMAPSMEF